MSNVAIYDASGRIAGSVQSLSAIWTASSVMSGSIDLTGCYVSELDMPDAWTTANVTVQKLVNGVWVNRYVGSTNAEYTIYVAASRNILIAPADLLGNGVFRFRSGTAASQVAQTAARTITITARSYL